MFGFKYSKSSGSDYKNLLDVFAELGKHQFDELSNSDKDELLGAYMADPESEDIRHELFIDFVNSDALSEMMYGSANHTPDKIGRMLYKIIKTGPHIHYINEDLSNAFTNFITSCEGYEDHNDELRQADNLDRVRSVRMG